MIWQWKLTDLMFISQYLFTLQKTSSGLQYLAWSKEEASTLGTLDNDEALVFTQVREAGNEGIWTKQLKTRTNLHQTVMNRCLKALDNKSLIKSVKSVKFPTRKIYMLASLTPSIELSGGPWFTDNEMDTVFINQLCTFLCRFIGDKTWPKGENEKRGGPLYPASYTPSLPTAIDCQQWLSSSQIATTDLKVDDIQSLLDVLVYDGKIEKIPCFPRSIEPARSKSRIQSSSKRRSRSRRSASDSSGSGSESEREVKKSRRRRRSRSNSSASSEEESHSDLDDRRKRKKRSSRSKSSSRSSKHQKMEERDDRRSKSRGSSRKESTYFEDDNRGKNSSFAKSILLSSEEEEEEEDDDGMNMINIAGSQVFVYRAIRSFRVETGWIETPCGHCPVFHFCQPGGPVNAEGCIYMRDWIQRSKASDVDGNGHAGKHAMRDIEDASVKHSHTNGTNGIQGDADSEEGEEAETSNSNHLPKPNSEEQYDEDDYGGEEL